MMLLSVRNSLMLFGGITAAGGLALIVTSVLLLQGLRKVGEAVIMCFNPLLNALSLVHLT